MSNEIERGSNIPKTYNPKDVEDRWYQNWLDKGYFNADVNTAKKPYTIVIPPPNVTAPLHMGHAFNNTIQDIFIRYKRKKGFETLWLPGTDHAGIATQNVVEKQLRQKGQSRFDLGREKFVERVWQWKEQYGNQIIFQLKKMGCSCDWRRESFTMDENLSRAVQEVFIRLYHKGYIYRGKYIINWCPRCGTAISDEEVEYKDLSGRLWHIKYPVIGSDNFLVVATTRPETMLGDTAVAVHPEDQRYRELIGKKVLLPLMQREIPVIGDRQVDPEFGTGAVKVTPAHDPNDFEIGRRHQLPEVDILKNDGTLNENTLQYAGMDRFDARKRVVKDLEDQGLLLRIEEHNHSVGHCHRCHTIVEPWLSEQWFVRMKDLATPAMEVVTSGRLKFYPAERWLKTYINWMENIRDWCISRQLWWGHRIPVYYCHQCGEIVAAHHQPDSCSSCQGKEWNQDDDVLDTWFTSWLWPFSTLGWPDETPDLRYFYPTSLLVTGPDIIFFWVARMIMAGLEFVGDVPFHDVYLNGIVRDQAGRKMSKSLGNGIDPLDMIEKYSADAVRFTLIMLSSEGQDINLSESHFEMGRNFSNKIWNAYRFLALNLDSDDHGGDDFQDYSDYMQYRARFQLADRWILSRLQQAVGEVSRNLESYRVNDSLNVIYHFFWHEFCDWYLELIKPRLAADAKQEDRLTALGIARQVMTACMNVLHPFVPFISEEISARLSDGRAPSIVISPWPEALAELTDPVAESEMAIVQQVISAVRNIRSEMNVPPGNMANLKFKTGSRKIAGIIRNHEGYIHHLARVQEIEQIPVNQNVSAAAVAVVDQMELFVPLEGLIDRELEKSRLTREINRLEDQVMALQKKLHNVQYLEKAPSAVVQQDREKQKNFTEKLDKLRSNLKLLN